MSKKLKNSLIIVGSILLIVFLIGVMGIATDGFKTVKDMSLTTVNTNNLLSVDEYTVTDVESKDAYGYTIDVTEDGEIAIEGKNSTETDAKIAVQTVSLQAKEYTLTANAKCDDDTYFVTLENADGSVKIEADDTFEIETAGDYTVYINIKAGEKIDDSFEIVLVEGEKAEPFFTIK